MMTTNIKKKERTTSVKKRITEFEYSVTVDNQVYKFVQLKGTCLFKFDGEISSLKKIATAMRMLYSRFDARYFCFQGKIPTIIKVPNNGSEIGIYKNLILGLKKQ